MGNDYGKDHMLTNNWNPEIDYKNEYANVHFRIEASEYSYPDFSFTEENEIAFYSEVKSVLYPLGWEWEKRNVEKWNCDYITKEKQTLYLHPQDFSGIVLKSEVKQIAEALEQHTTFYLRWVDLYETVYDISDYEYEGYLNTLDEEIRKKLFEVCQTKRKNKYYYLFDVCRNLAEQFRLHRIGENNKRNYGFGQTIEHIEKIADNMVKDGLIVLVENNGNILVRSINKTEQRKLKIKVA